MSLTQGGSNALPVDVVVWVDRIFEISPTRPSKRFFAILLTTTEKHIFFNIDSYM